MALACIRKGDSGSAVVTLQRALGSRGYGACQSIFTDYDSLTITELSCEWEEGIFDGATKAAVKEFQGDEDLGADGIVGPDTWTALGKTGEACKSSVRETITSLFLPDTVADADVPAGEEMKLWDRKWFWPAVAVGVVGIGVVIYRGQK
jgi:murein L,D-transpeptidase YcbB/YkuD